MTAKPTQHTQKRSVRGTRKQGAAPSAGAVRPDHGPLPPGAAAVLAALAAFVLIRGLVTALGPGDARLWGVDFARWLDGGAVSMLLLWLPLFFLLPSVARLFFRDAGRPDEAEGAGTATTPQRWMLAGLLTAAAVVIAWQLPVAYAFLGDGTWYAAELYRSMTLPDYANSMIKPSAWFTGLLIDAGARAFHPDDIRLPFVLSGLGGMLAAAAAVFFVLRNERAGTLVAAGLLLLCGSGSLVFFGYIELYAPVYALSVAYLVTAWQSLRAGGPVWLPVTLLVLALLFGGTAAAWLPSLLLLLHWKFRGEEGSFPLRRAAVALMLLPLAAVAGLYLLGGTQGDSAYLVALQPYERVVDGLRTGWQRYVLTAPERWADLFNMLWLGLGPALFVLPVLLVLGRRKGVLRTPAVLFGLTAAAGGLTLLLFGNTFLGLARDWDVGAFALLGSAFLTLALWQALSRERPAWNAFLLPGLAAVVLSHFVLWISVNASERASSGRFESIAAMDDGLLLPMNSFTAWENLRKFHQSGGDTEGYFRVLRRQIGTGYRSHIGYAEYLSSVLKLADASRQSQQFEWLFSSYLDAAQREGDPSDQVVIPRREAREFSVRLLLSAMQTGHAGLADAYEPRFRALFSPWPESGLLEVLRSPSDPQTDSVRIAAAVTEKTGDAFLHMTAGGLFQQRGMYEAAAAAYDRALEREPALYPSWYLVAADLHRQHTGNPARARELLQACIANAPASPEAERARAILAP